MQIYYHALLGYTVARHSPKVHWVILGAVWSDLHYLPGMIALWIAGREAIPAVFTVPWVQAVTAVTHSAVLWLVAVAIFRRSAAAQAFLFGWFTHIAADVLTHQEFAAPYLWPLSNRPLPGPFNWLEPITSRWLAVGAVAAVAWLLIERYRRDRVC